MSRTYTVFQKLIASITLIIACVLLFQFFSNPPSTSTAYLVGCGVGAAVLVILFLLRKKLAGIKHFTFFLFVFSLALRLIAVLLVQPPIESDFLLLYQASQSMLRGDFSFQDTAYFSLWANQTAFVAWQAMFLKLWNNPLILKIINAVLASASICLLYSLTKTKVSTQAARLTAVTLSLFPFFLTLPTVLSNQIPSVFFILFGMWILLRKDAFSLKYGRFFFAGIFLQLGSLLGSGGILMILAIVGFVIIKLIENPKLAKQCVISLLLLLFSYIACFMGAHIAVKQVGLNKNGLANGNPAWTFVTGLNYKTNGLYSERDWARIAPTLDEEHQITDSTRKLQWDMLEKRTHISASRMSELFLRKAEVLWCRDALDNTLGYLENGDYLDDAIYRGARGFDRVFFVCMTLLMGSGAISFLRKKNADPAILSSFITLNTVFCAFLLIEVQPHYAYLPLFFLFWCATHGMQGMVAHFAEE